jgi:peroxiredoxin
MKEGIMHSYYKVSMLAVGILAFFALSLGCEKDVDAGLTAPDFSLPDLSGQNTSLKQFQGQVVILDFWATWCFPCRMSIPELVKIQEKYRDKGLVILGISLDNPMRTTNKALMAFKNKFGINYRILRYDINVIRAYFGQSNPAIPTMFLIDRNGKIKSKIVGFRPDALKNSLANLLK